jgi:hypothetical protein
VATFGVSWSVAGEHGYILLSCGQQFNSTPFIRIIEGNYFGHHIPQQFRLATDNASIYNDAYLEMYLADGTWNTTDIAITVWIVNKPPINSSVTLFSAKTVATTSGYTYYQVYGYHPIDTNWNGARFCMANTGRVGIGTNDPGQSLDVSGTIKASTQVITPSVSFSGTSSVSIYNGNIDTYNPTGENNLMIYSWWGIGFKSYDGVVRIGMDTRTGDAYFGRNITAKNNLYITNGGGGVNISNGNNGSQILMGWHGTSHQHRHSIQTRHNGGSADNSNAIDFYIWTNAVGIDSVGTRHGLTIGGTGVGIGTTDPSSKLYVQDGRVEIQTGAGRFTGLHDWTSSSRAQLVLSSWYSDLVIASSHSNDNHGSTLSFVSYNPSNYNDYRKWVINQGNWGARLHMLDFGYGNYNGAMNPHTVINGTDTVLTLDGANKRVGIGSMNPSAKLDVVGDTRVTGMLNIGNVSTNYNSAWSPSILLNCLDQAEITVHDAGARVVSAMFYNGGNRIYIGRDVGWGSTPVELPNSITVRGNIYTPSLPAQVSGSGNPNWGRILAYDVQYGDIRDTQCEFYKTSGQSYWQGDWRNVNFTHAVYKKDSTSGLMTIGYASTRLNSGVGLVDCVVRLYNQSTGQYWYSYNYLFRNYSQDHCNVSICICWPANMPAGWYDMLCYTTTQSWVDGNDFLSMIHMVIPNACQR